MKKFLSLVIAALCSISLGCATVNPKPTTQFSMKSVNFGNMGVTGVSPDFLSAGYKLTAFEVPTPPKTDPASVKRFLEEFGGLDTLLVVDVKGKTETKANKKNTAVFVGQQALAFLVTATTGGVALPGSSGSVMRTVAIMDITVTIYRKDGSVLFTESLQEEYEGDVPPDGYLQAAVKKILVTG